jgi:hypothetical protein
VAASANWAGVAELVDVSAQFGPVASGGFGGGTTGPSSAERHTRVSLQGPQEPFLERPVPRGGVRGPGPPVLQHGRIVEEGSSVDVCDRPEHEYTRRLVAAAPVPDPELQRVRRQRRLEVKATA